MYLLTEPLASWPPPPKPSSDKDRHHLPRAVPATHTDLSVLHAVSLKKSSQHPYGVVFIIPILQMNSPGSMTHLKATQLVKWLSQDSDSAKRTLLAPKWGPFPTPPVSWGCIPDRSADVCILMEALCYLTVSSHFS